MAPSASEETETGNLLNNISLHRTLCRARRQTCTLWAMACNTIVEELRQENLFEQKQRLPINHEAKLRPTGRLLLQRDIHSILFAEAHSENAQEYLLAAPLFLAPSLPPNGSPGIREQTLAYHCFAMGSVLPLLPALSKS